MRHYSDFTPPRIELRYNFASNLNPIGPPNWFFNKENNNLNKFMQYPELWHWECDRKIASIVNVDSKKLLTIPGSSQFISMLFLINNKKKLKCSFFSPTFWEYKLSAKLNNVDYFEFNLDAEKNDIPSESLIEFLELYKPDIFFVCTPNNPTGHVTTTIQLQQIMKLFPKILLVLDLTYAYFLDEYDDYVELTRNEENNIICITSYSKFFCLPGLRIASAIFSSQDTAKKYREYMGPLRINSFSEYFLPKLLQDKEYIRETKLFFYSEWEWFENSMNKVKIDFLKSYVNTACFRLFKVSSYINVEDFCKFLMNDHKIWICNGKVYDLVQFVRFRIGKRESNKKLLFALSQFSLINRKK